MGKRTIEEELERQDYILLQTTGISMEPLLHNRKSSTVIRKAPSELKKYDVVLFKRPGTEEYVLHRIWKIREKDYLICGDNGLYMEPVARERILGVMTGFYPDESGRFISCDTEEYRRYLRGWNRRYCLRWLKALPGRVRRKLLKPKRRNGNPGNDKRKDGKGRMR